MTERDYCARCWCILAPDDRRHGMCQECRADLFGDDELLVELDEPVVDVVEMQRRIV